MTAFKHILCPIDFSDPCHRSVGLAGQMARDFQSELTVLHVVDTRLPSLGNLYALQDTREEVRRRAELEMATWKESAKLPKARWDVVEGIPHRAIVESTKERGVDLLIMASHGYSGVERLLLGSVTEKVLHQIGIPILAVGPSGADGGYEPFGEKRFRTILVAVDLGPATALAIGHAAAIGRRYGSKLLGLHVLSPLTDVLGGPLWPAAPELTHLGREVKARRAEEMEKQLGAAAGSGVETETLLWEGDPAETILRLVDERGVDLVVMGAHGHGKTRLGWMGSTTHKVIRAARSPVLAVRKSS